MQDPNLRMWLERCLRTANIPPSRAKGEVPRPSSYLWLNESLARATSYFSELPWNAEDILVILAAEKHQRAQHLSAHWQGLNA